MTVGVLEVWLYRSHPSGKWIRACLKFGYAHPGTTTSMQAAPIALKTARPLNRTTG
jgi:hypothetical protein